MGLEDNAKKLNKEETEKVSGGASERYLYAANEITDLSQLVVGNPYYFEDEYGCWGVGNFRGIVTSDERWYPGFMRGGEFYKFELNEEQCGGNFHERESNIVYYSATVKPIEFHVYNLKKR